MDPVIYCAKCGMERNCLLHRRAEFPPHAALKWMLKHHKGCNGELQYRAGLAPAQRIIGQEITTSSPAPSGLQSGASKGT